MMSATRIIRAWAAFAVMLSLFVHMEGFSSTPCNPVQVDQFTMTFMAPFVRNVPAITGEMYYFTVSGTMNFYSGTPCGQWDAYYRYNSGPPQYSPVIGTNFTSTPCPPDYNPAHFYTSCVFTATSNQLTFTYGDSFYGDNCGSMLITVFRNGTSPSVFLGKDTSICQGASLLLDAGNPGDTYLWSTAATTRTILVNGSGTYAVTVTNNAGCTGTDSITVTGFLMPVPSISGDSNMCVSSGYYHYVTDPGMNSYQWTVSAGATMIWGNGTPELIVTWDSPGLQLVTVNYFNANGCTVATPSQLNVMVDPLPAAAGLVTGRRSVCAGSMGVNYSVPPVAGSATYVWSLPPGVEITGGAGTNSIIVDFSDMAQSGSVTVYGNNLCGNGEPAVPVPVIVNPIPPVPEIIQSGEWLVSSALSGNQWYRDGMAIMGAVNDSLKPAVTGNYSVKVTLIECESLMSAVYSCIATGTPSFSGPEVTLFPAPNDGRFVISLDGILQGSFTVYVINGSGAEIYTKTINLFNRTYLWTMDLRGASPGLYTVVVDGAGKRWVKRVPLTQSH
jgi:hypothetical protein